MSKQCPFCGGTMEQKTIKTTYTYKDLSVEVEQPGMFCDSCEEGILSKADHKATEKEIHDLHARGDGLLLSDEIRSIRKGLGLNQQEASKLFGGGVNAFSRYECGETMQSKALDQLLRTLHEHAGILDEIKAREVQVA